VKNKVKYVFERAEVFSHKLILSSSIVIGLAIVVPFLSEDKQSQLGCLWNQWSNQCQTTFNRKSFPKLALSLSSCMEFLLYARHTGSMA
jgi:hypothetical protein